MNKYDKLQYPIFMQCREYTLDEYWQDVFGSCAQGKFPKGMRMENSSTLCIYNGKNAKDLFSLPREENEVFKFMMDKFKSRGMRSNLETDNEMRDIQSSKSITEVLNDVNIWKEIKNPALLQKIAYYSACGYKSINVPKKTRKECIFKQKKIKLSIERIQNNK